MIEGMPTPKELAEGASYRELDGMPNGLEKAAQYLVCGLFVDGGHHKKWCIEQALAAMGVDLARLHEECESLDNDWEPGIPP